MTTPHGGSAKVNETRSALPAWHRIEGGRTACGRALNPPKPWSPMPRLRVVRKWKHVTCRACLARRPSEET